MMGEPVEKIGKAKEKQPQEVMNSGFQAIGNEQKVPPETQPEDLTAFSPLVQDGGPQWGVPARDDEVFPWGDNSAMTGLEKLKQWSARKKEDRAFTDNPEAVKASLMNDDIPPDQKQLISNALDPIPVDHLADLSHDGIKIQVAENSDQYAHYRKKDSTIYLSQQLMDDLSDPAKKDQAETVIRHEIGHAFLDSYVLGKGNFRNGFLNYVSKGPGGAPDSPPETQYGDYGFQETGDLLENDKPLPDSKPGEIHVNDEREEQFADAYATFFSPDGHGKGRLLRSGDTQAFALFVGSKSDKQVRIGNPFAKPLDVTQDPYYNQATSDDDPWGVWAR
ncbi:MAG: hypothetical protein HYU64_07140 [Armatimonadetes bacterium]|nr:hypothetical protein [Armatimonadota bacterium]